MKLTDIYPKKVVSVTLQHEWSKEAEINNPTKEKGRLCRFDRVEKSFKKITSFGGKMAEE